MVPARHGFGKYIGRLPNCGRRLRSSIAFLLSVESSATAALGGGATRRPRCRGGKILDAREVGQPRHAHVADRPLPVLAEEDLAQTVPVPILRPVVLLTVNKHHHVCILL